MRYLMDKLSKWKTFCSTVEFLSSQLIIPHLILFGNYSGVLVLNASRQVLRNNDTMGKSVWKMEEKEGTYDSPNHFTPIR